MIYKYKYQTPNGFSDMIMNSDGKYLTGLWFEGSKDMSKHEINCEEKNCQYLSKRLNGWTYILVAKSLILFQNI